jgi:hypothetical protein
MGKGFFALLSKLRRALATHSTTVVLPIPQHPATWRWLRPHSHSNRNSSRIFLTLTLRADISPPISDEGTRMPEVRRLCLIVAALLEADSVRWRPPFRPSRPPFRLWAKTGRLQPGMGGRLQTESVVAFERNGWSPWTGIRTRSATPAAVSRRRAPRRCGRRSAGSRARPWRPPRCRGRGEGRTAGRSGAPPGQLLEQSSRTLRCRHRLGLAALLEHGRSAGLGPAWAYTSLRREVAVHVQEQVGLVRRWRAAPGS